MAERQNPDYRLIENLSPSIVVTSNTNSAEVIWVGKYSHLTTCGVWVESVSKYSEIVTWDEIPCSNEGGTETVTYNVDWHGITISGTIKVIVEKCPCEYDVVTDSYTLVKGSVRSMEYTLDPDDTEVHIEYTVLHTRTFRGFTCEPKTTLEYISDVVIQNCEKVGPCTEGDEEVERTPVQWDIECRDLQSHTRQTRRNEV